MLEKLRDALDDTGKLVAATPLPFDPFFYDGPQTRRANETLDVPGRTWEEAIVAFVHRVLAPLGLSLESVTRAPYLSGGDSQRSIYVLDDAIFVCRQR